MFHLFFIGQIRYFSNFFLMITINYHTNYVNAFSQLNKGYLSYSVKTLLIIFVFIIVSIPFLNMAATIYFIYQLINSLTSIIYPNLYYYVYLFIKKFFCFELMEALRANSYCFQNKHVSFYLDYMAHINFNIKFIYCLSLVVAFTYTYFRIYLNYLIYFILHTKLYKI